MTERNAVRHSYDELADVYATQRSTDEQGMERLSEFLDSVPESAVVLDAGCGQGAPVLSHLSDSVTAVGLDFSRTQLELAMSNAPGSALVQGEMTALPFAPATVDAVLAYWSLIHVPMADHRTVIEEFARVLRPGGRVLLCEGTNRWDGENANWLDSGVSMTWNIAGADATRDQLGDAGFSVVERWETSDPLEADEGDTDDDDRPWTFFVAQL